MKKSLVLFFGFVIALTAAPFVEKSVAADKITLGIAISRTGRYAEPAGRMVNSYNLYVDQMNAKGGWNGKKIDLIMMDDKSDKQTSIKLYEKLITQDKVDLTMGPYSSGITDAVANVLERYKYPTMAPGAASGIIWKKGRKYLFDIIAVAQDYQKGALHIAKDIGVKRIAIVGEDSLFPRQSAEGAVEWAKKLGLKVVLNENYPRKQTDFTGLLQKIKARRAEAPHLEQLLRGRCGSDSPASRTQHQPQDFRRNRRPGSAEIRQAAWQHGGIRSGLQPVGTEAGHSQEARHDGVHRGV